MRVDSGIAEGGVVGSDYDPMLSKVIAHGADRAEALRRLDAALAETVLLGLGTNIGFLRALLADPDVRAGHLDTGLVGRRVESLTGQDLPADVVGAATGLALLDLEPRGGTGGVVDPFDLPGGWRVGEPAWTTLAAGRRRARSGRGPLPRAGRRRRAVRRRRPTRPHLHPRERQRSPWRLSPLTERASPGTGPSRGTRPGSCGSGLDGRTWAIREQEAARGRRGRTPPARAGRCSRRCPAP